MSAVVTRTDRVISPDTLRAFERAETALRAVSECDFIRLASPADTSRAEYRKLAAERDSALQQMYTHVGCDIVGSAEFSRRTRARWSAALRPEPLPAARTESPTATAQRLALVTVAADTEHLRVLLEVARDVEANRDHPFVAFHRDARGVIDGLILSADVAHGGGK